MRRMHLLALLTPFLLASALPLRAENGPRSIRIIGREKATVTTSQVRLGDVADVTSARVSDDEAIIALQKIVLADAPKPGRSITLSAQEVLERLRGQGVDLQRIGYALQRITTVQRAGRTLLAGEVREAIEEYLRQSKRDVSVKDLSYRENVMLTPGITELRVSAWEGTRTGQMVFEISATVENEPPTRFKVQAAVDEWRELPVAARPVQRGALISEEDIKMARLNAAAIPADATTDKQSLIGLQAERAVGFGEVFPRNKLVQPPLIASGSEVMLVYKTEMFTATATGVALEAGQQGQEIKVRNTASKKVVMGKVLEAGLVGVK